MKINLGDLALRSSHFEHLGRLPTYATVDGEGVSPPLQWVSPPASTRSYALVSTDPDAPLPDGFDHWVVYNLSPEVTELAKGAVGIGTDGRNSKGEPGWSPSKPPPGHGTHVYYFHLYALDRVPNLPSGLTRIELLREIEPHIIEQARIAGTYSR